MSTIWCLFNTQKRSNGQRSFSTRVHSLLRLGKSLILPLYRMIFVCWSSVWQWQQPYCLKQHSVGLKQPEFSLGSECSVVCLCFDWGPQTQIHLMSSYIREGLNYWTFICFDLPCLSRVVGCFTARRLHTCGNSSIVLLLQAFLILFYLRISR